MASSERERLAITLSSTIPGSPISRVLDIRTETTTTTTATMNVKSPFTDEKIWMRLREAGFDEESIKRRDKAALIAYIAKLESEVHDYQHHMGLLLLERKDWTFKYEELKASVDTAEMKHKLDRAAHFSALAEARKKEESLKKDLGVAKECITNMEKTVREKRIESAEAKVEAEGKMVEAHSMFEAAQKKFAEAEAKLHAAESLEAEASRCRRVAERKLQEVEEREDAYRRRLLTFKSECDAKEKEISLERQSLSERQKTLQQGQERLLESQALLNQREEYISERSRNLSLSEKELEASEAKIKKESRALSEEKSGLDLKLVALSTREKAILQKEEQLSKKEQELLVQQENLATKEYDVKQKLTVEHKAALEIKKSDFEAELDQRCRLIESEMETKRRACELREVDLVQREESVQEKEHELEGQLRALLEKERDVTERLNSVQAKEENLIAAGKAMALDKLHVQKEKEEIANTQLELQKSMLSLENIKKEIEEAQEKLETAKRESTELLVLEIKLKEEIDNIRAQKTELMAEADRLVAEKSKFETEWELIDEKREELKREAELVAEERKAVSKLLKEERDNLKLQKEELREQFKKESESIACEQEAFISKLDLEHSEWFSKIQQERSNFVSDIEMQKRELENCIDKRREEIESHLREKEEAFEEEKKNELLYISSLKEIVAKEQEQVALEMKKLDKERVEILMDRERREKEQADVKKSIEELQVQMEKLKEQRELLHADRESIVLQIQQLQHLEDLKVASEDVVHTQADLYYSKRKPAKECMHVQTAGQDVELKSHILQQTPDASPPSTTPVSWIRRCAKLIFKPSPGDLSQEEKSLVNYEDAKLLEDNFSLDSSQKLSKGNDGTLKKSRRAPMRYVIEKPGLIVAVPSLGEKARSPYNLKPGIKAHVTRSVIHSYSEQEFMVGRKRLNESSSCDDLDTPLNQRQNYKKRRQGGDDLKTPVEESTSNCAVSTPTLPPENEDGITSSLENQGDQDQTINGNRNIPDSTTTTENQGTDVSSEQAKLGSLKESISVLVQGNIQGMDSDEYACSPRRSNGVKYHDTKESSKQAEEGEHLEGDVDPASQVIFPPELYVKKLPPYQFCGVIKYSISANRQ
ncbi:hypothetical protein MKW94_030170 [Papaver nudicaule]|uniref:Nuclear matrix constituent protein 1-like protein n=1 Tax=Papaver nudicaule TaxID=74823 RepID=A0AA41S0L7_PAPNU|nr:hypothetical protein [Papaver nudicaule]